MRNSPIRIDTGKATALEAAEAAEAADAEQLRALGYPQLLRRGLSGFRNAGVAYSIICVTGGMSLTYGLIGMVYGGPAVVFWGWLGVGLLVLALGASMGELTSAYPTSGGLYYWSARLARHHSAAWAWFTGWFNVVGLVAGVAASSYGFTFFACAFGDMQWGWKVTPTLEGVVYVAVLIVMAVLGSFGGKIIGFFGALSIWWNTVLSLVIIVALLVVPAHHQSVGFVLTTFVNRSTFHWGWYVSILGLLVGAETFVGYDACAHLSEETKQPGVAAARGMVRAILAATVVGAIVIYALSSAIQNYASEAAGTRTHSPVGDIFVDALGFTFGKLLVLGLAVALFVCVNGCLASNSRMVYAFSRDFARTDDGRRHRLSKLMSTVDLDSRTPRVAVWFSCLGALLIGALQLWSTVAFATAVTVNVIGLYTAYAIPVFLRLRLGRDFERGAWHLGRWSYLVGWIAVGWVALADLLFCLPVVQPVFTWGDFPYTLPAFLLVIGGAGLWWGISARKWFIGPRSMGTPEQLAALEGQLIGGPRPVRDQQAAPTGV